MQSSKEQFFNARKAVMKDIQHESSKIIGKCTGYSKITRAAWAIVAGKPEYAELLYGQKAGSDKSYQILMKLNADAIEALKILNWIRIFYYQDGDFQRVWPPYLRKEIDKEFDNSVKVSNSNLNYHTSTHNHFQGGYIEMTNTNNHDTFYHNNRAYSISICIDPKKFRKLCQERKWVEGCFSRTYEETLQMVDTCHSIGDLMILANHIELSSHEKHASNIAEWILSDCCHFMVYEMEPLPKPMQRKLKIRHLLSRFKK